MKLALYLCISIPIIAAAILEFCFSIDITKILIPVYLCEAAVFLALLLGKKLLLKK